MCSKIAKRGQRRRGGRNEEAPTRHLQVGGIDPWSANINELDAQFMATVRICYFEERNFGPEFRFCLEAIRRREDYVEFLSALDVSPRVLTWEELEEEEAGRNFEYAAAGGLVSGELFECLPPGSTLLADRIQFAIVLRRDREWEFMVQNRRQCGPDAKPLNEAETSMLVGLPRLIVPTEGALVYSMDEVRRIVEGLPATEQLAFHCETCPDFVLMTGEHVEDEEHPTAKFRCACGCLYDDGLLLVPGTDAEYERSDPLFFLGARRGGWA